MQEQSEMQQKGAEGRQQGERESDSTNTQQEEELSEADVLSPSLPLFPR